MARLAVVGTGFVADHYLRSLATFSGVRVCWRLRCVGGAIGAVMPGVAGKPRLIYAELDNDFIAKAPIAKRLRLAPPAHPKVKRRGSVVLNHALGRKEMAGALAERRPCGISSDLTLHLTEMRLAIQASRAGTAQTMQTRCAPIIPMPRAAQLRGY